MDWSLEYSAEARADLAMVQDFLLRAAFDFGTTPEEAELQVRSRIRRILADIDGLKRAPYRGTLREHLAQGLRSVTLGRAVIWFRPEEERGTIRVVGVFYGGQDHIRHMTRRLHKPG